MPPSSINDRRAWLLPALVIGPRVREAPKQYSVCTRRNYVIANPPNLRNFLIADT
jgi:hypothetical protein